MKKTTKIEGEQLAKLKADLEDVRDTIARPYGDFDVTNARNKLQDILDEVFPE